MTCKNTKLLKVPCTNHICFSFVKIDYTKLLETPYTCVTFNESFRKLTILLTNSYQPKPL